MTTCGVVLTALQSLSLLKDLLYFQCLPSKLVNDQASTDSTPILLPYIFRRL